MNRKPKKPTEPAPMLDTVRHELIVTLEQGQRSAKELSFEVRISEKEVYDHLEHIRKSLQGSGRHFAVMPAECRKCGFVFSKRSRLRKPRKCPLCRGESIHEPLFFIAKNSHRV
jgi:hypothetical protein